MSSPPPSPPTGMSYPAHALDFSSALDFDDEPLFEDERALINDVSVGPALNELDDDGGGLFGDTTENDHGALPHLDSFDEEASDDEDYDNVSIPARVARALRRRDPDKGYLPHPCDLLKSDEEDTPRKKQRLAEPVAPGETGQDGEVPESSHNLSNPRGNSLSLRNRDPMKRLREEVFKRFARFLHTTVDEKGNLVYRHAIREMCNNKECTFTVNFRSLAYKEPAISEFLSHDPFQVLEIFDKVGKELVHRLFPHYKEMALEIHVRISDLPLVETLRSLRKAHLNHLVRIIAVVSATSGLLPQMSILKYDCARCGDIMGPFVQQAQNHEVKPVVCPNCQGTEPFPVGLEETVYRNYQKITIQESPGSFPAGRIPRSKICLLLGDLYDRAKPGDEVDITGIYTNNYDGLNTGNGSPVFSSVIICNHIMVKDRQSKSKVQSLTDVETILKPSKDPNVGESRR